MIVTSLCLSHDNSDLCCLKSALVCEALVDLRLLHSPYKGYNGVIA